MRLSVLMYTNCSYPLFQVALSDALERCLKCVSLSVRERQRGKPMTLVIVFFPIFGCKTRGNRLAVGRRWPAIGNEKKTSALFVR